MTLPTVVDPQGHSWGVGNRSDGAIVSVGGLGTVDPVTGLFTEIPQGNGTNAGALRVALANDSTGPVIANAGTNLNTSLLALEGGNIAGMLSHLATIDTNITALVTAGEVGIPFSIAAPVFARPGNTTTYVIGQLVANTTSAGITPLVFSNAARANGGSLWIYGAYIDKNTAANLSTFNFTLHLFNGTTPPTVTNGDGSTYALGAGSAAHRVGTIGCTGKIADASNARADGVPDNGSGFLEILCGAGQTTIWGHLVANSAYPPGNAEQFTVTLVGEYRS